jgi:hypothetical protein
MGLLHPIKDEAMYMFSEVEIHAHTKVCSLAILTVAETCNVKEASNKGHIVDLNLLSTGELPIF